MNVALYGGKFDPPHLGHLNVISQALMSGQADEVWVIPAKTHPWRKIYASGDDRLRMLQTFRKINKRIKVLDMELKRDKITMTIDTIRELMKLYPDNNFGWLCGADTIERFDEWDDHEELLKLMKFLVYPRLGYEKINLPRGFYWLKKFDLPKRPFSSTTVRNRVEMGESIVGYVTPEIEKYISRRQLYKGIDSSKVPVVSKL